MFLSFDPNQIDRSIFPGARNTIFMNFSRFNEETNGFNYKRDETMNCSCHIVIENHRTSNRRLGREYNLELSDRPSESSKGQ